MARTLDGTTLALGTVGALAVGALLTRGSRARRSRPAQGYGYTIPAEAHSDDYEHEVIFDAEPWFAQASDDEIRDLAKIGWGGDYAADSVAQYLSVLANAERTPGFDLIVSGELDNLFEHTQDANVGFEVHIDPELALIWLRQNRIKLFGEVSGIPRITDPRPGSRAIPGPYARGGGLASFNVKPGSRARAATVTLGEMAEVAIGLRDADLWLPRKGKGKGEPTRTFDADHVGIRVTRTDVLLPEYVRYALQYLAMKGLWNEQAVTVANVKAIQFQPT